jgi:hypothetical protein
VVVDAALFEPVAADTSATEVPAKPRVLNRPAASRTMRRRVRSPLRGASPPPTREPSMTLTLGCRKKKVKVVGFFIQGLDAAEPGT